MSKRQTTAHHLDEEPDNYPEGPHVNAQQKYYEARHRADYQKKLYELAYKQQKEAEAELIQVMLDGGHKRLEHMRDGTKIFLNNGTTISVTEKNEHVVRKFLRQTYGDETMFTTEKMDKSAISDRIKQDIEAGELSPLDIPDDMKYKQYGYISVNGWKDD